MTAGSTTSQIFVLNTLIQRGWISLRQMGVLLGYKELRGVYARQKSPNPIPVIQIGGIARVYPEAVFEYLKSATRVANVDVDMLEHVYNVGLREHNRLNQDPGE